MQGVQCNMANCRQQHFEPHHTAGAILYFNYLPKIANCSMNDGLAGNTPMNFAKLLVMSTVMVIYGAH